MAHGDCGSGLDGCWGAFDFSGLVVVAPRGVDGRRREGEGRPVAEDGSCRWCERQESKNRKNKILPEVHTCQGWG